MVTFPIPEHISAKAAPKAFICHMRHLQSSSDDFPERWLQMPGTKIAQVPIQDEMTYQQMKLKKGWFQDIWLLFCSTLKDIVPEELEESCYRWVVEEQRGGKSFWNPSDYYFSDINKLSAEVKPFPHPLCIQRALPRTLCMRSHLLTLQLFHLL